MPYFNVIIIGKSNRELLIQGEDSKSVRKAILNYLENVYNGKQPETLLGFNVLELDNSKEKNIKDKPFEYLEVVESKQVESNIFKKISQKIKIK